MKELYKLLHIEGNPLTAYHPQTDGQMERVNEELEQFLCLYVNHWQTDWVDWLALVEFAYNNREHSVTKLSPFFVNTGVHPMGFTNVGTSSANLLAEEFAKHVKDVHELAQVNLVKDNNDMECFYDHHAGKVVKDEAGNKVFLDGQNIKTIRPTKKMDDKWFSPFEVVKKVVLLKPAVEPSFESQRKPPPPPPVIVKDEEEYEVEEILNSHLHQGKLQFLVKWVRYDEATWQPESDIGDNAKEAVKEFYRKHPGAPRRLSIPRQNLRSMYKFMSSEGLCGWSGRPTLKGG
ncbi:hypothetical protein ACEPAI_8187 [Sanghuangporus weigelae]